jgi:hypothetical protein
MDIIKHIKKYRYKYSKNVIIQYIIINDDKPIPFIKYYDKYKLLKFYKNLKK